ncbi:MAG: hypothetical protein ACQESC_04575 [Nanobdellota archaeon]
MNSQSQNETKMDKEAEYQNIINNLNLQNTPGEHFIKTKAIIEQKKETATKGIEETLFDTSLKTVNILTAGLVQGAMIYPVAKKYEAITQYSSKKAELLNASIWGNISIGLQNVPGLLATNVLQESSYSLVSSTGEGAYTIIGAHAITAVAYNLFRTGRNLSTKSETTLPSINASSLITHIPWLTSKVNSLIIKPYKQRAQEQGTNIFYAGLCQVKDDIAQTFNSNYNN